MDFARPLVESESTASKSGIRYFDPRSAYDPLDRQVLKAANQAAAVHILGTTGKDAVFVGEEEWEEDASSASSNDDKKADTNKKNVLLDPSAIDTSRYTERTVSHKNNLIQEGDLVVIQVSFNDLDFVYVTAGDVYSNRHGHFHHDDFLRKPWGCKVRSRSHRGYGFCYLLRPTPELWTRSLRHRTQIVHELDQSQILFQLHLRPNCTVIESGTGSGAVSHAIARTVAPTGRLHTFEFHQHRVEQARTEFEQHGISHLVTVHHVDVCQTGFHPVPRQSVDAAFLDLPEPWRAVPAAAYVLRPNARICTYSPCVEQVQRTVQALEEAGFHSIKTFEYRLQEHYVDEVEYELPPSAKKPRRDPHTLHQQSLSQRKDGGEETDGTPSETDGAEEEREDRKEESVTTAGAVSVADQGVEEGPTHHEAVQNGTTTNGDRKPRKKKMLVARPFPIMRGHTAFLTFATAGCLAQPNPYGSNGKPQAENSVKQQEVTPKEGEA